MKICLECGGKFHPHRERMFEHEQVTCGQAECQRARKTRLQRDRREQKREAARILRRNLRQRRSTLPQDLQETKQCGSTVPQ